MRTIILSAIIVLLVAIAPTFAQSSETDAALVPQTTCPVMDGNAINKKLYIDHEGERIYVCCNMCINEFNKDPETYLKKIEMNGQKPVKIEELEDVDLDG
jgi:YHS domain-containing protein